MKSKKRYTWLDVTCVIIVMSLGVCFLIYFYDYLVELKSNDENMYKWVVTIISVALITIALSPLIAFYNFLKNSNNRKVIHKNRKKYKNI